MDNSKQSQQEISSIPRRGRGRPAGGDSSLQKKRIVEEATRLFSEKGFEAASIQTIADRTGVDRRLVYHYFKSKKKLYLEVMTLIYKQLDALTQELIASASDIETLCGKLLRKLFGYCLEHQESFRLLIWENQRQTASLATLRQQSNVPILRIDQGVENLNKLIADGAARGVCRKDIDPIMLYITLLSTSFYVIGNRWSLSEAFGIKVCGDEFNEQWMDHVTKMIVDGIRP